VAVAGRREDVTSAPNKRRSRCQWQHLHNAEGYLQPNPLNAYSLNNITATKASDGSVTVQFGGCDAKTPNCLPIVKGWNYLVRLYRPRVEILNGTWKFPEAVPVGTR
jgi:hypothetical protein